MTTLVESISMPSWSVVPGAELGAPNRLHVELLQAEEALAAVADDWNRLAGAMPFRRWEWADSWWRHYRTPNARLFVLAVRSARGRLAGLAPWYLTSGRASGRVVRFLGDGEVCSEYPTILAESGAESQVTAAVADWMSGVGGRWWDLIELSAVESCDRAIAALTGQFMVRNHRIHQRHKLNCWRAELPGSWDSLLKSLSKSRRSQVRQLLRKHFERGGAQVRLLADPAELDARLAMLADLHQRRRQQLGQRGCFASPRFAAFHQEMSRRMLASGQLRLVWTELAGRPIAADYSFTGDNTVYYYQSGIEPAAESLSPGWLGMIGTLRLAIEQGYRRFDFLRGDEPYKASWGAVPRPLHDVRIVARRTSALFRDTVWAVQSSARGWLKSMCGRQRTEVASRKSDVTC
jgi:CelD/BcsL family acetyltransferase involved in cellulose biosynthesis